MIDRSFSLALALQAIGRRVGRQIDVDDLQAVLGLSMIPCAVPASTDPASWTMYARDACLEETGRVFGMAIRPVHPPEAAKGLGGAAEFAQHFEASYRPLVAAAIENEQPVLAWQGWPGEHRLMWGVVDGTCEQGIGLSGATWPSPDAGDDGSKLSLDRPPVQLYVVETVTSEEPSSEALIRAAVTHARRMLEADVMSRFGVFTGPGALTCALEAVRSKRGAGPVSPTFASGHQAFSASISAGWLSAIRFFTRQAQQLDGEHKIVTDSLMALCQRLGTALSLSANPSAARAALAAEEGRKKLVADLSEAVAAATDLAATLKVRAQELGVE